MPRPFISKGKISFNGTYREIFDRYTTHTIVAWHSNPHASCAYPLISHEELTVDHLPRLGAGYDDLVPFCLSFDGYGGGLRSVEDCTFIADSVEGNGLPTASIESLRVAAFTRQRAIKWMDAWPPDERLVGAIVAVIDELRRRLESRPL